MRTTGEDLLYYPFSPWLSRSIKPTMASWIAPPQRQTTRATTAMPANSAIHNSRVIELPYIGPELFTVEATSFQRKEQFYGGPPSYFE